MKICCFLLLVLFASLPEVVSAPPRASESSPKAFAQGTKKEKKQNRADRKKGNVQVTSKDLPPLPEIRNVPPVRPNGKLRMEVDQIKTAALWVDRFVGDALIKSGKNRTFLPMTLSFTQGSIWMRSVAFPTDDEAASFLKNKDPEKRRKLIDKLLLSDGYRSHLFNWLADLLRHKQSIKRTNYSHYEDG